MIELLLINSSFIFGLHAVTRDNMLLYKPYRVFYRFLLKRLLVKYNDDAEKTGETASFILKPLFDCPPCMASVWGLPFVLTQPISIWTLVYLFALSGFNYIIMKIISK